MSTNGKIKIYKNPARNRPEARKPYVPQYQLMGVEPEEYKSPLAPGYHIAKSPGSKDNPRAPRPVIRQPYAETVNSPIGRGRGPLPNVGNNVEQTWSSVDGEIVDDMALDADPSHSMVDNNEFVTNEALGLPEEEVVEEELPEPQAQDTSFLPENVLQEALNNEILYKVLADLEEDTYLLLVSGDVVCSGPLDFIQDTTRELVFGEHELTHGNPVSVDDIVVIKRVKVKVGVFLE